MEKKANKVKITSDNFQSLFIHCWWKHIATVQAIMYFKDEEAVVWGDLSNLTKVVIK